MCRWFCLNKYCDYYISTIKIYCTTNISYKKNSSETRTRPSHHFLQAHKKNLQPTKKKRKPHLACSHAKIPSVKKNFVEQRSKVPTLTRTPKRHPPGARKLLFFLGPKKTGGKLATAFLAAFFVRKQMTKPPAWLAHFFLLSMNMNISPGCQHWSKGFASTSSLEGRRFG